MAPDLDIVELVPQLLKVFLNNNHMHNETAPQGMSAEEPDIA